MMTAKRCQERLTEWGYRLVRDDERGPRLAYLSNSPLAYCARATALEPHRCGMEGDDHIVGIGPTLSEAYESLCEAAAHAAVWQEPVGV